MSTCYMTFGQMLKTRRLNRLKNVMCYGLTPANSNRLQSFALQESALFLYASKF